MSNNINSQHNAQQFSRFVRLTKTVTLPDNVNVNSKKKSYLQASNRISCKFMYGTTRKHWTPSLILSLLDYT